MLDEWPQTGKVQQLQGVGNVLMPAGYGDADQAVPYKVDILIVGSNWQNSKASRNDYLQKMLVNIRGAYRRFRRDATYTPKRRREMQSEHRELAKSLAAGDPNRAELLAKQHIGRAIAFRLESLDCSGSEYTKAEV